MFRTRTALAALAVPVFLSAVNAAPGAAPDRSTRPGGVRPTDRTGRALNLDFETGDLRDWRADGSAFQGQPVRGDKVHARRNDMHSGHTGNHWVGTYEVRGDPPRGTLTSVPFTVTRPYARFLVAGGAGDATRVEIVRADTGAVVFRTSGDNTEDLKPVAADLSAHVGKDVFLRLVDEGSDGWGHLNFDDFTLWDAPPPAPIRSGTPPPDRFANEGLPPEKAAAAMTVPAGFRVALFAGEPDVVQPIAFAIDDRGRLWVAEAYSYPVRVPQTEARDRILIFEDADNDGRFDSRKVFADKLNLVSGIELGFGGVWVGAAPHLLFVPDRDGDDRPDGPPQVLLDGWGNEDTHETLNSFTWGPDGWLYGCHGVFTHSRVGKPGTRDADRVPINAGIWRYHPTRHRFEVFAHGTSNPWGVDFDANGQAFLTSCVIPHLYHVVQNARYERQAGAHFNPYTYDDIKTIADHRHYLGATPHSGNGRSDQAGGGHAHAGAMIYLGGRWPREYHGSIFMNNIHGARLNRDVLTPSGSGFVGSHAPDFLLANDRWSQVVSLKYGPDGNAFMIDWYDKNQCHRNETEVHDRTNGRIFKIAYGPPARPVARPLDGPPHRFLQNSDLTNHWLARHALRRLREESEKHSPAERDVIADELRRSTFPVERTISAAPGDRAISGASGVDRGRNSQRLYGLWGLHAVGRFDEPTALRALSDQDPYLRAWAVQLSCESGAPTSALLAKMEALARADPSPVVRLYLASALQRLPVASRWAVVEGLAAHGEDAHDPNLPLMVWYAAEPLAQADASKALRLAFDAKLETILPFMVRRVAAIGTPGTVPLLVDSIGRARSDAIRLVVVEALNTALRGRRRVEMPAGWSTVYPALREARNPRLRSQATVLALTFGDPGARTTLRDVLADRAGDPSARREAFDALLKSRDADLPPTLIGLLDDPGLRGPAIRGLAAFDDPAAAGALLGVYARLNPEERRDAVNSLAARAGSGRALLNAVGVGRVASSDLSADVVRQLRNLKDAGIDALIVKVWGTVRETSADRAKQIARYRSLLTSRAGRAPDPELGRAVFAKACQQCHTLFGVGAKIGPDLTGSNRADLDYVLSNVLDPSALIGKDYMAHVLATVDGRVLTGLVRGEDKDAVTLQTANELVVVPRGEIDRMRPGEQSMMPDDLWANLNEHEIRSLVAYLASPSQVPMLATEDNVGGFFNRRDLTGWSGEPGLWSVENGEIVGKTEGLRKNEFLRSDLSASDFRLTLRVKLVGNAGNSGVQFRSAALPDGEMKGDQADIGPGWWGKLYEENGRGLLWDKSGEAYVKPGDWNTYEITARGPRVTTRINGHPCVDLDDPQGARRGIFALQIHAGGPTEVRVKDVRLELIPNATQPLGGGRKP